MDDDPLISAMPVSDFLDLPFCEEDLESLNNIKKRYGASHTLVSSAPAAERAVVNHVMIFIFKYLRFEARMVSKQKGQRLLPFFDTLPLDITFSVRRTLALQDISE